MFPAQAPASIRARIHSSSTKQIATRATQIHIPRAATVSSNTGILIDAPVKAKRWKLLIRASKSSVSMRGLGEHIFLTAVGRC